ncbi:hypothetical protein TNCV_1814711 [Trichonephila clavipes]|nr:hypothetical protein TNCV_1814711 [Trichonephila clavipes]
MVTAVSKTLSKYTHAEPQNVSELHRQLCENGSFIASTDRGGRLRTVRQAYLEEFILDHVDETPGTNPRAAVCRLHVSQPAVWRVLQEKRTNFNAVDPQKIFNYFFSLHENNSAVCKYDPKFRGLRPLLTTKVSKFKPLEIDSPNPPLPGLVGLVHVM